MCARTGRRVEARRIPRCARRRAGPAGARAGACRGRKRARTAPDTGPGGAVSVPALDRDLRLGPLPRQGAVRASREGAAPAARRRGAADPRLVRRLRGRLRALQRRRRARAPRRARAVVPARQRRARGEPRARAARCLRRVRGRARAPSPRSLRATRSAARRPAAGEVEPRALPQRRDLPRAASEAGAARAPGRKPGPGRSPDAREQRADRGRAGARNAAGGAARVQKGRMRALRPRMVLAGAVVATLVCAIFALLLSSIDELRASARSARHSEEVIGHANALEKLVLDLETGQRGFVITHEERFLEPWRAARRAYPREAKRLEALVAGNAAQEHRAREIAAAIESYYAQWSLPVVRASRRSGAEARALVAAGGGKRRVDAIRARFTTFVDEEQQLAEKRRRSADSSGRAAIGLGIGGVGLSLLLLLAYFGYLTRAVVFPVHRVAGAAARLAG